MAWRPRHRHKDDQLRHARRLPQRLNAAPRVPVAPEHAELDALGARPVAAANPYAKVPACGTVRGITVKLPVLKAVATTAAFTIENWLTLLNIVWAPYLVMFG